MTKRTSVIIVGRMNVGKSTLFNRLSVSVKSITLDFAGVTRDFIKDTICWKNRCFDLIDTGGISLRKTTDPILQKARQVALDQLEVANLVLFVVDGTSGVVTEDREIAKILHKAGKSVILVVNKIDAKMAQDKIYEFEQLGFKTIVPISATHAQGIGDLLEEIVLLLPEQEAVEEEKAGCRVVLLGKPNVGKSSLMNLLLKKERSIVSEVPGTTREAISEKIAFYQEDILVTDTPGIRKKRAVTETLETLMVKSSLRALEDTDIVLLLIDASEGKIADQELKLAFFAFTQKYKAVVLLYNKQDLVTEESKEQLKFSLEEYEYMLDKIPQLSISCKTEKNVGKILPLVKELCERYNQKFSDQEMTALFKEALIRKPLYHKSSLLIIYAVRQIKTGPITIVLVVNEPKWFGPSQLMYFENTLRKAHNLEGVPIRFVMRKRR
jgi:GTP-binding protein